MLGLAAHLHHPACAVLAPQAAGGTWYPRSFMAPFAANEPWLSSALRRVGRMLAEVEAGGPGRRRTVILGFSQGACLALELAARHPTRYGAVVGLTGGLLGPPGRRFDFAGSFAGTPALLAAGDPDPHVPWSRVEETARVYATLGAEVTLRRYPGLPHTVNDEELALARELVRRAVEEP
jgi:predicted esterase